MGRIAVIARRTTRLLLAPVILVLAGAVVVGFGAVGAVVAVPSAVYWLISSVGDAVKVLTVTPSTMVMRGYAGGPITVAAAPAPVTCRYVPFRVRERSVEAAFLEIRDAGGNTIKVWRYGWGRRTRALFAALGEWLDAAGAEVSPDARQLLSRAGGGHRAR